jgi:hypothetical protein
MSLALRIGTRTRVSNSPASQSVHAVCGAEFVPLTIGWPPVRGPLPGNPPDPDQVCQECIRRLGKPLGEAGNGYCWSDAS